MTRRTDTLKLNAMLNGGGSHVVGWRHPLAQPNGNRDFAHFRRMAQTAERGKLDALFVADVVATQGSHIDSLRRSARADTFEPLTLLAALAAVTQRIGLIATATTTYNAPYHIARKFASLDHLSGGRAGWNLVTSVVPDEAANFGATPHLAHADRYARADEFQRVVAGLWDSWEDDAFIEDKAAGLHFDHRKLHVLDHHGPHFSVRGPLNVARAPQGHPVLVQAGSSEAGRELAARCAEVIFTAQHRLDDAQAFYADVKGRLARHGRRPEHLKILPGVMPIVGATEAEARDKLRALQDLIDPVLGLRLLADNAGDFDLSGYPLDGPLPELPPSNRSKSRQQLIVDLARRENLTIRQLYERFASAGAVTGTPKTIADRFEEWFLSYGADGFNVAFAWVPGGLDDFVDLVVPELQRRRLFRTEYEGPTLRDQLGLPRPPFFRRPSSLRGDTVEPVRGGAA
ncbi:LLM class flavin-dependent oxidoreductase [Burkholderia sp. Bp8986]|uniref:LLM class flavin-dependent oxidoreductase n=1 Tax=Burkholderia sp. Bp8986 TaxID=2184550 RepID=UPI000F5B6BD4|nr:LLM class flavin-dependent oxidoreductase [Burkholderia sp. Bp8986]RQS49023.1 FMN-dependent monooxygenase [Burkholderia sp. Bp8986]